MAVSDPFNELIDAEINRMRKELGRAPLKSEVADRIKERYPQRIEEWLARMENTFLQAHVTKRVSLARRHWARKARHEMDVAAERVFEIVTFYVPARDAMVKLGDMTGADHESVAGRYEVLAAAAEARGEFHRYLAEAVGNRLTRHAVSPDVVTRRMARAYDTSKQVEFDRTHPRALP